MPPTAIAQSPTDLYQRSLALDKVLNQTDFWRTYRLSASLQSQSLTLLQDIATTARFTADRTDRKVLSRLYQRWHDVLDRIAPEEELEASVDALPLRLTWPTSGTTPLAGLQISEDDVMTAQGSPVLRRAIARLEYLSATEPDVARHVATSERVIVATVPYSDAPNYLDVQQHIASAIGEWDIGIPRPPRQNAFDYVGNDSFARCARVLYLFPFFLTPLREHMWTVLPFGHQTTLGFILHNDHPALKEWTKAVAKTSRPMRGGARVEELRGSDAASGDALDARAARNWIQFLISETARLGASLYSLSGYVCDEIVAEIVSQASDEALRLAFLDCSVRLTPEREYTLPFFVTAQPALTGAHSNVYLFDPADIQRLRQILRRSEYTIVIAEHGIDVPVGVGVSILGLPRLLANGLWRELLAEAVEAYLPYKEKLREIGIVLDRGENSQPPAATGTDAFADSNRNQRRSYGT